MGKVFVINIRRVIAMISYRSTSIGDPGAIVDVTLCRNIFIAAPGAIQYMQYMGASVDVTSPRDGETLELEQGQLIASLLLSDR